MAIAERETQGMIAGRNRLHKHRPVVLELSLHHRELEELIAQASLQLHRSKRVFAHRRKVLDQSIGSTNSMWRDITVTAEVLGSLARGRRRV